MTNYTDVGFKKIRLSDHVWNLLREYWEEVVGSVGVDSMSEEYWPEGNTYTNHW